MQTVVFILMVLVCFNFVLKQSFGKLYMVLASAAVCALFTALMWHYAVLQSKAQIASWLASPEIMLDTAVILTVDVMLYMGFCLLSVRVQTEGRLRRMTVLCYRFLSWFPGILIFPVLFSILVTAIFSFPGVQFSLVAWITAAVVFVVIAAGALLLRYLFPDRDVRLELLFLSSAIVAVLGVIATVNGRTAIAAAISVDWKAFAGVAAIVVAGILAGLLAGYLKAKYAIRRQK